MNNMMQLGMGLSGYQAAHETLPPGTVDERGPILNLPKGNHISWLVQILPYVQERTTYKYIDLAAGAYAPQNANARRLSIALFRCPSYAGQVNPETPLSNYAGCHNGTEVPIDVNNDGVLFLNSHIRNKDIIDGAANTIFAGEKSGSSTDMGWMSGTRATLRNCGTLLDQTMLDDEPGHIVQIAGRESVEAPAATEKAAGAEKTAEPAETAAAETSAEQKETPVEQKEKPAEQKEKPAAVKIDLDLYVGGFGSYHPYGVNFLFGDGAVHFTSTDIELKVLEQLGNRADGKLLEGGPTRGQ